MMSTGELGPLLARTNLDSSLDFVVGAVIVDPWGRLYFQRRTLSRALFPGCWDLVGGHVEAGESLEAALRREIAEETGWTLTAVRTLIQELDWQSEVNGQRRWKKEFDFLVHVSGDLQSPRLETQKHDAFLWIGPPEIAVLQAGRHFEDDFIWKTAQLAFTLLAHQSQ